ncbi:uncharacterized protein LOC134765781 [Penaeus indicus]|uniref:uncharacterized protein LOC134765781 n=1 Tax=Penaeus indicus TaxID=29960 RepID=UPI00300CB2D2
MDPDVLYSLRSGKIGRIVVTSLLAVVLVYTLVLNGLAGPGLPPFTQSTGNISDYLFTCVTPAGYTFSIWGVIYFGLVTIVIYDFLMSHEMGLQGYTFLKTKWNGHDESYCFPCKHILKLHD